MARAKKKLIVLMATYNGEKYIKEQIKSISKSCELQKISYEIIICDDFSKDSTLEILKKNKTVPIKIIQPPSRLGSAKKNFSYLLNYTQESRQVADYYMLSDQDDIWSIDKVKVSLNKIKEIENKHGEIIPSLIFTDARVVDVNLNTIHDSYWDFESLSPETAYDCKKTSIHNVVQGATVTFNKELLSKSTPIPINITMHDRWLAMVAIVCGNIAHLPNKTILYRQHALNQVGSKGSSFFSFLIRFTYYYKNGRESLFHSKLQASEFMALYKNEMKKDDYIFLKKLVDISNYNFFYRKYFIIENKLFLGSLGRNFGFLILI